MDDSSWEPDGVTLQVRFCEGGTCTGQPGGLLLLSLGIFQELWLKKKTRVISLVIYVLMGWVAVVAVVPLLDALTWKGFAWLVAGGVAYTVGIIFFVYDDRFEHWHGIWHLFVLAGSALHFFAIVFYVA